MAMVGVSQKKGEYRDVFPKHYFICLAQVVSNRRNFILFGRSFDDKRLGYERRKTPPRPSRTGSKEISFFGIATRRNRDCSENPSLRKGLRRLWQMKNAPNLLSVTDLRSRLTTRLGDGTLSHIADVVTLKLDGQLHEAGQFKHWIYKHRHIWVLKDTQRQ